MYLKEPIHLSGGYGRRARRSSPVKALANVLFLAAAVGINYFVFFRDDGATVLTQGPELPSRPDAAVTPAPVRPATAPAAAPAAPASNTPAPSTPSSAPADTTVVRSFDGRLGPGDTVFRALESQGIDHSRVGPVLAAMQPVFDFRKARVGHRYSGELDGQGRIVRLKYVASATDEFLVELQGDEYVASKKQIPVDIQTAHVGCAIGTSLFASLTRCGETPDLAQKVSDLFAFDVDFFQEIRPGDVVKVIVEKEFIGGRFSKYGRILAASYEGSAGKYTAVLYKNTAGREAYYTAEGVALEKEFLKSPLKYTRISSGYTHPRFPPTLHQWRKHLAIDYAAPVNTPVQAVASGTIRFVGEQGPSGNLVIIDHAGGYQSYYAHLNKFGDYKVGDTVTQRSVVGFVGQTGRATGPHLHFALKKGDKFLNPLEVSEISASPLESERDEFTAAVKPLLDALTEMRVQALAERQG